ncbi:MAG: hypothetical protein ACM3RX_02990 [Methanococcaceae archaeon]
MSEHEKSVVEEYCKKMDTRHSLLMKVIWGLLVLFFGAGLIQFVTFGELKAQVKETDEKLQFIDRNYVPTIFLEGMQQNYSYQLQEIVATFTGDENKVRIISQKYNEFQQTMIKQMIGVKGGISSTTRSIKSNVK